MIQTSELIEKFEALYDMMATSNNPKYMQVFGGAMKEMFKWFADNRPETAQDFLDTLCAIKWNNYLTKKEADRIISKMEPAAMWSREQWKREMEKLGIVTEEAPYYNMCALYVEMNAIYSDSGKTIAELLGTTLDEITNEDMLKAVHRLALDKLKDIDGVFNIRTYFGL